MKTCIADIADRLGLTVEPMESLIICTENQRAALVDTCRAEVLNFRADGNVLVEPGSEWFTEIQ